MHTLLEEVSFRIKKEFGDNVEIDFVDEKGDGKHFFLSILSEKFEWTTRVWRSQQVYTLLDDLLKTDSIHALRMNLKSPSEL